MAWKMLSGSAGALAVLLALASGPLFAQDAQPAFSDRWHDISAAGLKQIQRVQQKTGPPTALPVSLPQALYLIRSTLLTLNDADRSGNYSVLHDLAAPGFQQKNSPADLAQIFAGLRQRHFDLFEVALAAPQLSTAPHLENNGMLRLTGYFPTHPLQINFDMLFENVGGQWRLFGLSVNTPPAPVPVQGAHVVVPQPPKKR